MKNKKTIYIVIILIVLILISAIGIYLITINNTRPNNLNNNNKLNKDPKIINSINSFNSNRNSTINLSNNPNNNNNLGHDLENLQDNNLNNNDVVPTEFDNFGVNLTKLSSPEDLFGIWISIKEDSFSGSFNSSNYYIQFKPDYRYNSIYFGENQSGKYKLDENKIYFYKTDNDYIIKNYTYSYIEIKNSQLIIMYPEYPKLVIFVKS